MGAVFALTIRSPTDLTLPLLENTWDTVVAVVAILTRVVGAMTVTTITGIAETETATPTSADVMTGTATITVGIIVTGVSVGAPRLVAAIRLIIADVAATPGALPEVAAQLAVGIMMGPLQALCRRPTAPLGEVSGVVS